jgi:glycerophosphoryl diester phosphodiesterase
MPELPHGLDANAHHVNNRRLRLALISAAALFLLALAALVGIGSQGLTARPDIIIIAHRAGAAGVPENSLTALRRTIAQGIASYAEIDVQETADGVVMVVHDSDLRRLASVEARVWDLTFAQIEQADIGKNVGPQFVGERIPTLDEFLDAAKGKIKLNIELKYDREAPLLAGKVVDIVRAKGMQNEVVISSLDAEGLAQVRKLAPELKIGFIYQVELGSIDRLDVDFLEPEASLVTSELMDTADARRWPVYAWTIDDAASAQRMYDAGVSVVITNDPPLVRQALKQRDDLSDQELIMLRFRKLFGL